MAEKEGFEPSGNRLKALKIRGFFILLAFLLAFIGLAKGLITLPIPPSAWWANQKYPGRRPYRCRCRPGRRRAGRGIPHFSYPPGCTNPGPYIQGLAVLALCRQTLGRPAPQGRHGRRQQAAGPLHPIGRNRVSHGLLLALLLEQLVDVNAAAGAQNALGHGGEQRRHAALPAAHRRRGQHINRR